MELFSQRNGIKNKIMALDEMPEGMRNRVWNVVDETLKNSRDKNNLIKKSWCDFFKQSITYLNGMTSYR